jgi:ADP-heptose:LPS heptosyltransferase
MLGGNGAGRIEPLERLPESPPAERVLVIRLGALGDVVRTRFAFAGVRALYPRARIDWLVEDRAEAGLVGLSGLDETIVVPRRRLRARHPRRALRTLRTFAGELAARKYDLSIDFHGVIRAAWLAWAAGIPVRVGFDRPFAKEQAHRFLTHRARLGAVHVSRFERNAALVRFLGGDVPDRPAPLSLRGLAPPDGDLPERFALIHPGTSPKTGYKRWETERFAAVARIVRERAGVPSLVAFGPVPGEQEAARAVVIAANGAAALAPSTRSLGELLALLARASVFVGCDSGPMHLATLAGTSVVGLFGPTDPIENAPFSGVPHRIVRIDVACNPCREGCPARSCMARLEPEPVAAAALELLAALPPDPGRGI